MHINRQFQREVLAKMYASYPSSGPQPRNTNSIGHYGADPDYSYLLEHGLIRFVRNEQTIPLYRYFITAKGIDFLEDDGGLSAVLGVVTVKLHDETIQALLSSKVEASNLPPEDKQMLLNQIRELRGEAAKTLVNKLIDYGLTKGPDAMQ